MDKEQLLGYLRHFAAQGLITKEEVLETFPSQPSSLGVRRVNIFDILYYIGGAIVLLGIAILVGDNWLSLSVVSRVLVTLGAGLAFYAVGTIFIRSHELKNLGRASFLVSAILNPIGLYVLLDAWGIDATTLGAQSVISFLLFGVYFFSYFLFKEELFSFFTVIFGTALYFSFTSFLLGGRPIFETLKFIEYRVLLAGLVYLLFGYAFSPSRAKVFLTGFLYTVGLLAFFSAALALGGWSPEQNIFWELIFPAFVFLAIFLSIRLKSKAFLFIGAGYLMGYIIKITAEYFRNAINWSLSLIVSGLLLIAIGVITFYLNQKYLSRT